MPEAQPCYLVVGADSMVGGALLTRLRQTGVRVLGTTRRREQVREGCVHLDLANDIRRWRPPDSVSVAILCAGETRIQACKDNPAGSARVNVEGISQLASNLRNDRTFVIYLSTNQVFDGDIPFRSEQDPTCPVTEYGRQKAEAERRLRGAGSASAIVRFTKILGPQTALFSTWAAALRRGQTIQPFCDLTLAPVPLSCVTNVLLLITARRLTGIFHVSGNEDISYEAAARIGAEALGADPQLVQPVKVAQARADSEALPAHTTLDMGTLRSSLGLVPPGVQWTVQTAFANPQLLSGL
jgi:dTDP-4-dehydrorhamnose reductase